MRTPPTGRAQSVLNPKGNSGEKTLTETTEKIGCEEEKEKGKEKRKRQEDSPEEVSNPGESEVFEEVSEAVGKYKNKNIKIMISPLKRIGRTSSFSEIESIIRDRKCTSKDEEGNDSKRRKREGRDATEEKNKETVRRTTIQTLKQKFITLKNEVERDILKTAEIERMMDEVMILIDLAETEEGIREEEEKDGNLKQRRIMNGLITRTKTYELFKEIEGASWPKNCYTTVKVKSGMCPTGAGDIVIWRCINDPLMDKEVARRCRESFPELIELSGETWETLILKGFRRVRMRRNGRGERSKGAGVI